MKTTTTLSALHAIMVNIDESEPVDESGPTNQQWKGDPYYDDDKVDAPVSDYDASMDAMKGTDEENFDLEGDRIHEEDPWGIGEGESDAGVPDDIQIGQEDDFGPPDDIQLNERDVREVTNKVHESMDDGMMDPRDVADAALKYMSEDDVADMARSNDWLFLFTDEDEEDTDDDDYSHERHISNRPMF